MTSLPALLRRQVAAAPAVPVALAVLVLVVAAVVTAWPRVLSDVEDRQVTHEMRAASVLQRDVIAVHPGHLPAGLDPPPEGSTHLDPATEELLGGMVAGLAELRRVQPEPLRGMLRPARFTVETVAFDVRPVEGGEIGRPSVTLKVDPYLHEHVDLAAGEWPAEPPAGVDPFAGLTQEELSALTAAEYADLVEQAQAESGPVPVALSAESAEVLQWEVGAERGVPGGGVLLLTGVFDADDPRADYWSHNPHSAAPAVVDDLNLGTSATASAYVHPAWDGRLPHAFSSLPLSPTTRVWFPLDSAALAGSDVTEALAQLRGLTAADRPVGAGRDGGTVTVSLASEAPEVLGRIQQQQDVTATVLAIVVAGPLGVTVAVLLLGARLLVARRRATLTLLAARGGSGAQLRGMTAAEGLVLGLPAAAAGAALAVWTVPGRTDAADLVLVAAVGLTPATLLALTTTPDRLREQRADLDGRGSRLRRLGEVVLVALAALSLVLLRQRGVSPGEGGVDPLLVGVPLLLALATCVVVVRVYPWPVRAVARALHRRPGLTGFLGAARSVRGPAGGLVPAVALVVGVGVALFSVVLSTTVSHGVQATAWRSVGADLRLSGPAFDPAKVRQVAAVDGVADVATVADAGTVQVRSGAGAERAELLAVDGAAVRAVQADGVGIEQLPAGLGAGTAAGDADGAAGDDARGDGAAGDGAEGADPDDAPSVPAVVSTALGGEGTTATIGTSVELEVLGELDALAGSGAGDRFLVVDQHVVEELTDRELRPRVLLVSVRDDADPAQVLERIRAVEPVALAESPAADSAGFLSSPMAGGMNTALVVAVTLSALLVVVAVVMTQMMGAPARVRLLAVLRTLGLDRRQARSIVTWELLPLTVVSVLAGAVLGVVVPWVVVGAMDLTAMTGGEQQPPLVLDPEVLGAVLAGLAAVVALAVTVSTMISGRADLATQLRIGEES